MGAADSDDDSEQEGAPASTPAPKSELQERLRVISEPLEQTAGSVTFIDSDQLKQQRQSDISRVLSLVPGVNIQEEEGYGLRPNIGLRGSGAERSQKITLLEDGILIAPAPYAAPAAYYFPTAGRMAGIEVRKGSSSIRQGPQTNGGVVNLMSTPIPNGFSGDFDLATGADGVVRGRGRLGGAGERFGWLIESFQQQADGFKRLDTGGDTGFELSDYMVKFRFNSGVDAQRYQAFEVKLGRTDQVANETYLGLTTDDFRATPNRRYAASELDRFDSTHEQLQLTYLTKPSAKTDIVVTAYRNDFFRNWAKLQSVNGVGLAPVLDDPASYATELGFLRGDIDSGDDALALRNNRREYASEGVQAWFGWNPSKRHDVELGLRLHRDDEDRFQEENGYRMNSGSLELTSQGAPGSQSNRISEASATAFFVRDTIRLGRWTLSPGLRLESIDFTRRDFGKSDPTRSGVALDVRRSDVTQWIPGVGVNYALSQESFFFAGIHRGFSPPGPGATNETRSEESVNYEFGYRNRRGSRAIEATAFFNDYTNLLGADTLAAGGNGDGDLFNGGAAVAYGVESVFSYDFASKTGGRISMPFTVTYTWTDAEFRSSFDSDFAGWGSTVERGDELPYIAAHQVAINFGLVGQRWSGFSTVRWSDSMRTVAGQGAPAPGTETDAYLLADVTLNVELRDGLSAFVQARNVTDTGYIVARRPAGLRPGLPRTTLVGVSWNF